MDAKNIMNPHASDAELVKTRRYHKVIEHQASTIK